MRIRILSDLHLEFGNWIPPQVEADVVVLAGDIHQGQEALPWIKEHFSKTPVVYVLGNHEFYGQAVPELVGLIRRATKGTNVHVLENSSVELGGVRFLGCVLWTDFAIKGSPTIGMLNAQVMMTDYQCIVNSEARRKLRPEDTLEIHKRSRAWLEKEIPTARADRTVIVTHHAPSARSEAAHHHQSPLAPAFASDLDSIVQGSKAPLWIHGHTHWNVDYKLGGTQVISNQRGYDEERSANFRDDLVLTI